jgi:hypothetical protein
MKFPIHKYFKTGLRLRVLVEQNDPQFEEYCQKYMASLYEIDLEGYSSLPYWVELCSLRDRDYECTEDDYLVEYRDGYHEPLSWGATQRIGDEKYTYIESIPLDKEIELQAHDGTFVHVYCGESFLRLWQRVLNVRQESEVTD